MLRALPRAAFALAVFTTTLGLARAASATASAEFYSQAGYRYGRFRARVQFPVGDGIVGSFFLWKDGSEVAGVFGNELDYEKIGADCAMQLNAIFGDPPAMHASLASGLSGLCTGYHTYMYEWTPDHIAWSVDGAEVRRQMNDDTSQAYRDQATMGMQFRFNLWPGTPALGGTFSASELPAQEFVSWVEYSTYTPGTGDDGGDFSFAWRESFEQGIPAGWAVGNWASHFMLSTHSPLNVTFAGGIAVLSLTDDNALGFAGVPPADVGDLPSQRGPLDAGVRDGAALVDGAGDRFEAGAGVDARSTDASSGDARPGEAGTATGDAGIMESGAVADTGTAAVDGGSSSIDDASIITAVEGGASGGDAPTGGEVGPLEDAPALADAARMDDASTGVSEARDSANDTSAPSADAVALADATAASDASSAGDSSTVSADGALLPPERTTPDSGCGCRIAPASSIGERDLGNGRTALVLAASVALALAARRPVRRRRLG